MKLSFYFYLLIVLYPSTLFAQSLLDTSSLQPQSFPYSWPRVEFGDIDSDDDLDAIVGTSGGSILLYRNIGTKEVAEWVNEGESYFSKVNEGRAAPRFIDIDHDGDLDVVAGNGVGGCGGGTLYFYENVGSAMVPEWIRKTKKMGNIDRCDNSTPAFGDLNGDGLEDLVVGGGFGSIAYYINVGTADSAAWEPSSLNLSSTPNFKSAPALFDIDDDGDLDLFSGNDRGELWFYENQGTPDSLHFKGITTKYAGVSWGHVSYSFPTFADIDGDGDGDLCVGRNNKTLYSFINIGSRENAEWQEVEAKLPVELVSFTALVDGDNIILEWNTASEENNAGFEVQRQTDGAFRKAGWVNGFGTTLEGKSYSYEFTEVLPGKHTFRLKQIDFDGAFAYSDIVEIEIEREMAAILMQPFPNPFNPSTTITFVVREAKHVRLELFDVTGKLIRVLYDGVPPANSMESVRLDGGKSFFRGISHCIKRRGDPDSTTGNANQIGDIAVCDFRSSGVRRTSARCAQCEILLN